MRTVGEERNWNGSMCASVRHEDVCNSSPILRLSGCGMGEGKAWKWDDREVGRRWARAFGVFLSAGAK